MANFYSNIDPDRAAQIDQLSRLIYELRENRNAILSAHDAENEDALLDRIQSGGVAEHPAYEHYLAARILADTRESARAALAELLKESSTK